MRHFVFLLLLGSICLRAQPAADGSKAVTINLASVVLSRVCTPALVNKRPPGETDFLTTDSSVCIMFDYNGAHKGDKIRVDWLNPLGTVVRSDRGEEPVDGSRSWQWTLPIAGQLGSFAPGDWKVSVFWNDMGIAALPFRISVPPPGPIEMISKTLLPSATTGIAYSYKFKVRGGEGPYRWASSGALPPGLSLSDDGVLSGTPIRRDGYAFTVSATDQAQHTIVRKVGIGIGPPTNVTVSVRALMDHKSSAGCAQGPPLSEFRAGQREVWLEFMVNGGKAGDTIEDNWFDATGEQVGRG